ncbi:MAG: hypothetical protein IPM97_07790 [Bdellovibrionaceae bacterium]|nr:hypothetical protein [Pseudobdellovibrionaceae bacterium]
MKKSGKKSLKSKEENLFDDPLAGDLSEMMIDADWKMARFELTKPKTETVTLRMSKDLLKGIKAEAWSVDCRYKSMESMKDKISFINDYERLYLWIKTSLLQ